MTDTPSLLLDHSIKHIFIEPGEHTLAFVCEGGMVVEWEAEGDCCSETWFADILNPEAINSGGAVVLSVEEIPNIVAVDDGRGRQDSDQFYGVKITTVLGTCTIIYRNSSNGYYGGNYSESQTFHPEMIPPKYISYKKIVTDWQA